MVSHRLSSKQTNIRLYRRWFHIGCQVYRKNLIRLYTEDGFTYVVKYTDKILEVSIQKMVSHRLLSIQIQSYKILYRRWFHIGCQVYR